MARFVAIRAIDLKLCTYVPLGHMTYYAKFQSDLILDFATRAKTENTKSAITPEQMIGSSSNFY
jgi:tryptophan synthase alpha subunit